MFFSNANAVGLNAGKKANPEKKGLTKKQEKALYEEPRSFVDFLPWVEGLGKEKAILLEDAKSVGAVFDIKPRGTEGMMEDTLISIRDTIENAIQDVFEEDSESPWVFQTYTFDDYSLDSVYETIQDYIHPSARGTKYSKEYGRILKKHMEGVCRPDGVFVDDEVTKTSWGGKQIKTYFVIYRRYQNRSREDKIFDDIHPLEALDDICEKFFNAVNSVGIKHRRLLGSEFHQWMLEFFNPYPDGYEGSQKEFFNDVRFDEKSLPYGDKFSESMLYSNPRSDSENRAWHFGDAAMRCISIDGIRKRPDIGNTTGEVKRGDAINAMMDLMPEGCVMVSTIVAIPQDTVEEHINAVLKNSIGTSLEADRTEKDAKTAIGYMGDRHKMYRASYAMYVKGRGLDELNQRTRQAYSTLMKFGFRAISIKDDIASLDNFVLNLPMKYDPEQDRANDWRKAQLTFVQHIANNLPLFGRSVGTGNPGIVQWNRGGEPFMVDPTNPDDRKKNAHLMLLGPTGSGKSATLGAMLAHLMGISRPRLFIIEVGDSFGLMGDWFKSLDLTVNKVTLKPGGATTLSPYSDAHKALSQRDTLGEVEEDGAEFELTGDDEKRDIWGEMEIIAKLMITGGEEEETRLLRRPHRRMIRDAIKFAAIKASGESRGTLTEDVRDAFYAMSKEEADTPKRQEKLREMGDAIGLFTDGFDGEMFNTEGTPWPEVDVTIIDLGTLAREGYEAQLAIALISCLNMINNIAERDQHTDREIIVTIDEAHVVTVNPLLSPYLVKMTKMWRKLGAWLWLATQNMDDYPDISKKMLNMIEWWICMVMPKEEIEEIARFKDLNEAQKALLLSASKSNKKYTEGVMLSDTVESLFRVVPPSKIMALMQTEKVEKAARRAIMDELNIDELASTDVIAANLDKARGFVL